MVLRGLFVVCALIGSGFVHALYTSSDDVVELTAANFDSKVIQSNNLWIVEFYAPWCGHCKQLAPEYKKAATALKGIVKLGAVDMDQHQSVGGPYGIKGFPTIKVFGANKQSPLDYQGARQAQGLVDEAMKQLKSLVNQRMGGKSGGGGGGGGAGDAKDVIELTDSNFQKMVLDSTEPWLVEFFAPWCGHCKNLAPHWQSAATELKGKMKLGALDATVHTVMAGRFGVQGFPTIKYFPAGKKSESDAEEFGGGRTSGDIVNWALEKIAADLPPPEVVQITDKASVDAACTEKQLCVISFLPHILDCQSKCRKDYIKTLKSLAEKHKKQPWGWVWSEAGSQPDLEAALGVGGFGYPAMAAMNARKWKFALLKGSFGQDGIHEFLRELSFGRGSTLPVKDAKMPNIATHDAWDGKDGQMPVMEDIDLSDIDLDEPSKQEL